jgi:hypothetical protein
VHAPPSARLHRIVATTILFALIGVVAWGVCRIPVQVSDSVGNMLQVQHQPLWDVVVGQFSNGAYVRPLLWAQIKLGFALAGGQETLLFKSVHVVQLLVLALLFIRPMTIATGTDLTAAVLASLMLVGLHTFDGMVREAFPVNSFLTIAIGVLAVINLALAPYRLWHDVAAVALFGAALLTIESGVLLLAAAVAARAVGFEGLSRRGVALLVLFFSGYLALRFGVLGAGSPGLAERASGFGFRVLEPRELVERFGANPWPFYAYNVAASFVTVLLAEPRAGVWWAVNGLSQGNALPWWLAINIAASAAATAVVGSETWRALAHWRRGTLEPRHRLLLVCLAVIGANAAVAFGYTKDVIMSSGGVCFALAAYAAVSLALARAPGAGRQAATMAVAAMLVLWSVRAAAVPYRLELQAAVVQNDWANVYPWLESQRIPVATPEARALVDRLRRRALRARPRPATWDGWRRILDLN